MKKTGLLLIVIFVLALALSACSSEEPTEEVAAEPQPTAVSNVPETSEEDMAAEEAPTEPVEAPVVEESAGVFDTAAMVDSLDAYVLRPDDMPNAYKIVTDGEQHMSNLKVINTVGEVQGKRYIAASGRDDGWSLELQRVNKEELIPYTIFSQVEVFETPEGAQTAYSEDWLPVYNREEGAAPANFVSEGCDLGDSCVMYYFEKLDPATEVTTLQYEIVFVYNNVLAQVMGRGADYDMNPDFLTNAAQTLFDKINAAPLVE